MPTQRQLIGIFGIVIIVLAVTSGYTAYQFFLPKQTSSAFVNVRVGELNTLFHYMPYYMAYNLGYFRDEHLNVTRVIIPTTTAQMTALISGDVDIVASATEQAVRADAQGSDIVCFTSFTDYVPGAFGLRPGFLPAMQNTTDMQALARSLKGATIGLGAQGSGHALIFRYFVQHYGGLDPDKDLNLVFLGTDPAAYAAALKQSAIDGVFQGQPILAILATQGAIRLTKLNLQSSLPEFGPGKYSFAGMCAKKSYIQQHQDVIRAFAKVMQRSLNTIVTDPSVLSTQSIQILQSAGISPEAAQLVIKDYTFSRTGKYDEQSVKAVIDFGVSNGWLAKPMPATQVYTNDYLT